jgi:hypothetical protein
MPMSSYRPVLAVGAALVAAATAPAAGAAAAKEPLHRPALVQTTRAGASRFLVSVSPAGSAAAKVAQAPLGCSIFSVSGTCAKEHAIALILYGATTASIEQAGVDGYDIVVQVLAGTIQDVEALQNYIAEGIGVVFTVAQKLEDEAVAKIAAILNLANASGVGGATPPPAAPAEPSTPVAPTTPTTPTTPVTPTDPVTTPTTPVVVTPLPTVTATGTVAIVPVSAGAQIAARRPLATVRVRLGAIGDAAVVPVPAAISRRLATLKAHHRRVRLVQRLTYRVHQPGDPRPDYRLTSSSSRVVRLGR